MSDNFKRMVSASTNEGLSPLQQHIARALINRYLNGERWRFAGIAKQYRVSEENVIAIWTLPQEQWPELEPKLRERKTRESKPRERKLKEYAPISCRCCGEPLSRKQLQKRSLYCSHKCHGATRRVARAGTTNCLYCGASLPEERQSANAIYCNRKCYGASKVGRRQERTSRPMASRDEEITERIRQGERARAIAQAFGVSSGRVYQIARRAGITLSFPKPPKIRKLCKVCGSELPKRQHKYCSETCRLKAQATIAKVCPQCHKEYKTRYHRQVFCSHSCARRLKVELP